MKIIIVGTGYVGLVTGACFADIGVQVICVDKNLDKIERLKKGEIPIYEPGLEELIRKNMAASRLSFDTDLAANLSSADVVFSAVGTPPNEEGEADLSAVMAVAQEEALHLDHYIIFLTKSTVPIGTGYQIKALIATAKQVGCSLEVLEAVERVNQKQKEVLFEKFITQQAPIQSKRVAIWGLSFKPETDDICEVPALNTIDKLLQAGCKLAVHTCCKATIWRSVVLCKRSIQRSR